MSVKSTAILKTAENEGGYAKPYGTSGETYAGVDRLHMPKWPGWKIIDAIKNTKGLKQNQFIKGNVQLDTYVMLAYQKYWDGSRAEKIKNIDLANFYFDFYFHKPAIAVGFVNEIAKSLDAAVQYDNGFLNAAVLAVVNRFPETVYNLLYKNRLAHYQSGLHPVSYKGDRLKYIKSKNGLVIRTKKYPSVLQRQYDFSSFLNYSF